MAKAKKETTSAANWKSRFETAKSNQNELFARFARFYDIKNAVYNTGNMAPWRSKVYIPILSSKSDDMIAKLLGVKPGWEVSVRDEVAQNADEKQNIEERRLKAQEKLRFDYDNPLMDETMRDKLQDCLMDAAVPGTGLAKVPWKTKDEVYKAHPILNEVDVDQDEEVVQETTVGFNDVEPVNIFNVFMSPAATSLQQSPWVIIREHKPISDLKDNPVYKNIDKLKDAKAEADEYATYNKSRNRVLNEDDPFSADDTVQFVEIFECYERDSDRIFTYAATGGEKNSWVELRNQKNPYWHGKYPLVAFYVKKKSYSFWGESLFETSERLQSAVNDIFNHYMDNWNLSIDGMIMQEENSYVSDFIVEPGGEFTYRGEQPKQFRFPEPDPQQLSVVMNVLDKSIEEATISPYAQGAPGAASDKTAGTATGIIRLQEAASDKLSYMKANFRQSLREIGTMWLFNSQQYMDRPVTVTVTDNGKKQPLTITPADLQGIFDLNIDEASLEPVSKEQQKQNHLEWVAHILQLQQASVNQAQITGDQKDIIKLKLNEIAEESSRVLGKKQFTNFIKTQTEVSPEVAQLAQESGVSIEQ